MKPLDDICIIDLTRVLAGPFCTMLFADLGANVIKVEAPKGDDSRTNPPFINGESTYFMSLNRGKRSIVLDLKKEEAKEILKKMVSKADVLVENFRPGTMEKLGLSKETLIKINPELIFCSVSGFGQYGPYKERPAYDIVIQAMSGIMSITGPASGSPTRVGASIGDITSGLFAAISILTALHQRQRSGKGECIDISMLDCMVAIIENAIVRHSATGVVPEPIGNRHPVSTPFDMYPTKDSNLIIAIQNNNTWDHFCRAINAEYLLEDVRFESGASRTENEKSLKTILIDILAGKTTNAWIDILLKAGVPCGPLYTIPDVVNDPHILAREMIITMKGHKKVPELKVAGSPIKLASQSYKLEKAAPVLGEHSCEILSEFGFSKDEIKEYSEKGLVG